MMSPEQVATPTGFERPETDANADGQFANWLDTLREVSPVMKSEYPELHDAVRSLLQRISLLNSAGDISTAAAEMAAMMDAMFVLDAAKVG